MVTNLQESFVGQRDAIERLFGVAFGEEEGKHYNGQQSGNSGIPSVKASEDNLNSTQLRKQETLNELNRTRQIRFTESGNICLMMRRFHSLRMQCCVMIVGFRAFFFILETTFIYFSFNRL